MGRLKELLETQTVTEIESRMASKAEMRRLLHHLDSDEGSARSIADSAVGQSNVGTDANFPI